MINYIIGVSGEERTKHLEETLNFKRASTRKNDTYRKNTIRSTPYRLITGALLDNMAESFYHLKKGEARKEDIKLFKEAAKIIDGYMSAISQNPKLESSEMNPENSKELEEILGRDIVKRTQEAKEYAKEIINQYTK